MAKKKGPSLAIGRGEKLPVSKGAGLTAKGRAEGEVSYIEYLRTRQTLFDAELDIASARVAKSAAISNVNQTMGLLP